jgi:hypothetical protein
MSDVAATPEVAVPKPPRRKGPIEQFGELVAQVLRDPNPILVKELRVAFRTPLFVVFMSLATALVAILVLGVGTTAAAGSVPPAEVGQILFQLFFSVAFVVVPAVARLHASTMLTGEKELRTYESLILSGITPPRIVYGKFAASYSAMFIVLVALSPIGGVAFLFGGISPWHVVIAFVSLLLAMAPEVAFGIAISSRLPATRLAILVALGCFFLSLGVFPLLGPMWGFGELAKTEWGIGMTGPFWFTEAITSRTFELDTWLLVVFLPLYVFLMPTWFFLNAAIAGVTPPAEDRSSRFKIWALVALLGLFVLVGGAPLVSSDAETAGGISVIVACVAWFVLASLPFVFMNEPLLRPRLFVERMRDSALYRMFAPLGPGSAPTLRFTGLLVLFGSIGLVVAAAVPRHLKFVADAKDQLEADLGLIVLAGGGLAVLLFISGLGAYLRVILKSGIAARVLVIATMFFLVVVPFIVSLAIDQSSMDRLDDDFPFVMYIDPIAPLIVGVNVASGEMDALQALGVVLPSLLYGLGGVLFWMLVEAKSRAGKKADEALRRSRDLRARASQPEAPLLQHRVSSIPGAPIDAAAIVPEGPPSPAHAPAPIEPAVDAGPHRDAIGLGPPEPPAADVTPSGAKPDDGGAT